MKTGKITYFGITIGAIASAYVSYVLNGVWSKGIDITTFTDTFLFALQHPSRNYYNTNTDKAIVYGLIIYGMAVLMYLTNRRKLMIGKEYGTAKFANIKMVNKRLADKDKQKNRILSKHVRMSTDTRRTMINNNLLVIGGSGAGKTFFMVKPNIMQLLPNGSFICSDPKGEVARSTGNMLKKNGYNVKVINLIDMSKSDCYNPFRYIREENDVIKLVTNIISNTTPKDGAPTDPFWTKSEGLLLQSLIYYVWLEMPEKKQNFRTVMELLSEAKVDPKGKDSKLTIKIKNLAKKSSMGSNHPA